MVPCCPSPLGHKQKSQTKEPRELHRGKALPRPSKQGVKKVSRAHSWSSLVGVSLLFHGRSQLGEFPL